MFGLFRRKLSPLEVTMEDVIRSDNARARLRRQLRDARLALEEARLERDNALKINADLTKAINERDAALKKIEQEEKE